MKAIKNILNRYRWDRIGVWTGILTMCFGTLTLFYSLIATSCNHLFEKIDSPYKIRPAFQLEQINKNRLETVATDFTYTLADGIQGNLHAIKADYTLLYFNNPGCSDCKRTVEVLRRSEKISELVGSGKMRVLALYPDEGLDDWKAACRSDFPTGWINARDASSGLVVKNELYAIRAIPSLYLLDKKKRVIVRDATPEQVIERLNEESIKKAYGVIPNRKF